MPGMKQRHDRVVRSLRFVRRCVHRNGRRVVSLREATIAPASPAPKESPVPRAHLDTVVNPGVGSLFCRKADSLPSPCSGKGWGRGGENALHPHPHPPRRRGGSETLTVIRCRPCADRQQNQRTASGAKCQQDHTNPKTDCVGRKKGDLEGRQGLSPVGLPFFGCVHTLGASGA